jgi:hypothetical protein
MHMSPQRYILIAGQGRSGTNWILEILDLSRRTHCRNEPNECIGSALFELSSGQVFYPELGAKLAYTWDDAVRRTSQSFGARDQSITVYKDYFSRAAQRTGLVRMAQAKKPRRALSLVIPSVRREEWPIPFWVVNKQRHNSLLPVHKLNMVPGWIVWVLQNRPEAYVVHIVRHPGGYLNSLTNRLWSTLDMEKVGHDNRERLAKIAACHPIWADRFGDLTALSPIETELWYWRYAGETIHEAGTGNPRYQLVKYEELTRSPTEIGRSVYQGCGLDWTASIDRGIQQMSAESQAIAAAWRDRLNADQVAAVEQILRDSLMRDWWAESDRGGTELPAGLVGGTHDARLTTVLEASS